MSRSVRLVACYVISGLLNGRARAKRAQASQIAYSRTFLNKASASLLLFAEASIYIFQRGNANFHAHMY